MPFTPYKNALPPDALDAAQEAFSLAWAELILPNDVDEQTVRDMIARRIMDHAVDTGERDAERLKEYGLAGFTP